MDRSKFTGVRLTTEERDRLELAAKNNGQNLSEYLRNLVLAENKKADAEMLQILQTIQQQMAEQSDQHKMILAEVSIIKNIIRHLATTIYQIRFLTAKAYNILVVTLKEKIPADFKLPMHNEMDKYADERVSQMANKFDRTLQ